MFTGLSVSTSITWSSFVSTTPMRNCSSTLWLIISGLSRQRLFVFASVSVQRSEQSCRASDGEQWPQTFKRLCQSLRNLCRSEIQGIFLHLVLCEKLILYLNICVYLCFSQEEYVSEGLQWSFVKYQDNQSCLDLIEGSPVSVFSLLNEV